MRWFGALAVVVLVACGAPSSEPEAGRAGGDGSVAPVPTPSSPAPTPAPSSCRPAPLDERAATVLALGIGAATTASAPLAQQVVGLGVGGIVLLGTNVVGEIQLASLVDGMRRRAPRRLLVAVDEEGGRVSRLRPLLGPTPSARELGRRPLEEIEAVGAERGAVLGGLGFDLLLAPVVDADAGPADAAIGDRAFAPTPAEAGARAAAFVDGVRRAGVATTAKHFPGQGGLADSHDGTVVSDASLAQVEQAATAAFRPVLDAGVEAVMLSHATFRALGPLPASLEPAAYRLLRSMGFEGVAVTDAVGMTAILDRWSLPEAAVRALMAGADLVLATPANQAAAMRDAVVEAVESGRLAAARLDEAVRRVVRLQGGDPAALVCG